MLSMQLSKRFVQQIVLDGFAFVGILNNLLDCYTYEISLVRLKTKFPHSFSKLLLGKDEHNGQPFHQSVNLFALPLNHLSISVHGKLLPKTRAARPVIQIGHQFYLLTKYAAQQAISTQAAATMHTSSCHKRPYKSSIASITSRVANAPPRNLLYQTPKPTDASGIY